jgi:hypothetical protein
VSAGIRRYNRGKGHSYTIDGQPAIGVTTALDVLGKPALINWAANITAGYAVDHWDELGELPISKRLDVLKGARYADVDQAARRGTEVHKLGEALVTGAEVEIPEALAGHAESYVRFLDEWEPKPLVVEGVVAHRKWRYCGTSDLFAEMAGERWVLDIKTSRSGIYPETALQLAAYRWAEAYLDENGDEQQVADLGITRAAAIHVRADAYDLIPLETGEDVFKDFLHILWCARMKDRMGSWRGDALTPPTKEDVA